MFRKGVSKIFKSDKKTANYKIFQDKEKIFRFYCDLSGELVYTSKPVKAKISEKQQLLLVWEKEARRHFNVCHKCGKWVNCVMYNADVFHCVECTPWENKPHFCLNCGVEVSISDKFCSKCGTKLQYGEVDKI